MGRSRFNGLRSGLWKKLKIIAVVIVVIFLITPIRNCLVPFLPEGLWYHNWSQLHTVKLLSIHIFDLFYYVDRSPYTGSCDNVRRQLGSLKINPEELPVYTEDDWEAGLQKVKWKLNEEDLWKMQHFKPSLTPDEQRELLYSVLVLAQAFDAFNITYFMSEGTLIGLHRHHGLIPWDDDVDLIVKADQWPRAKEVLSCIPNFSLNMGRDFMWKFMWNESKFWRHESFIRFPYVDVFPYNEDANHMWPLTIWMKREIIWRRDYTYPGLKMPLEGYLVSVPQNSFGLLLNTYGPDTNEVCVSRDYKRKEREPFPYSERVRVPCRYLYDIYPFVFHTTDRKDGTPVQIRKVGSKVLSTFKFQSDVTVGFEKEVPFDPVNRNDD